MAALTMQPQTTPTAPLHRRRKSPHSLSMDLSDLPQLSQPTPPSNTLIITNLNALEIFQPANLESIRNAINQHATIHTFSPLKSFRRIICSFYSTEDAINIRQVLDGETVLGDRVRVFFSACDTKIEQEPQHLPLPDAGKLFFISPPPSPPVGWEMRNEDPPNQQTFAPDHLAEALSKLRARPTANDALNQDSEGAMQARPTVDTGVGRQRSGSTLLFEPHTPELPSIAVDDTESPSSLSPMEGIEQKFPRTSRPPVELME